MSFRWWLLAGVLAFSAALGVMVGQRLSREAMVILLGVVAGVAASIPTSLIVVWLTRSTRPPPSAPAPDARPQIIVMPSPLPGPTTPAYLSLTAPLGPLQPARSFTVIGGEEMLEAER